MSDIGLLYGRQPLCRVSEGTAAGQPRAQLRALLDPRACIEAALAPLVTRATPRDFGQLRATRLLSPIEGQAHTAVTIPARRTLSVGTDSRRSHRNVTDDVTESDGGDGRSVPALDYVGSGSGLTRARTRSRSRPSDPAPAGASTSKNVTCERERGVKKRKPFPIGEDTRM